MKFCRRRLRWAATVPLFAFFFLEMWSATGQEGPESVMQLLMKLAGRNGQPHREIGLLGCSQVADDRAVARRIAALGTPIIPYLEERLDAAASGTWQSPYGLSWIQLSYAKILGRRAGEKLRGMGASTGPEGRHDLDRAIALAMGLTSYVSPSRPETRSIRCSRAPEPRDALDRLLLHWEQGNESGFELVLGPQGRKALREELRGTTWDVMRSAVRQTKKPAAIGYRFLLAGRWAEPDETLDETRELSEGLPLLAEKRFRLETQFVDAVGRSCGSQDIWIYAVESTRDGPLEYLVDNAILGDLIRRISYCGSER